MNPGRRKLSSIMIIDIEIKKQPVVKKKMIMKKQFYIIMGGLWSACIPIIAQHTLQSALNMFRPGDEIVKQQVEYKDPGRLGENVLWDFSRLAAVNDEYTLYYAEQREYLVGMEHQTGYRYDLSHDSLLCYGFENRTTVMRNNQPELLLHFPVSYRKKTTSHFHGHGLYSRHMDMDAMGIIETEADAFGMMVLPDKDTLRNVIRIKTVKQFAETMQPVPLEYTGLDACSRLIPHDSIDYRLKTDSLLMRIETYRWYSKGYRYPVFETVRSWVQYADSTMSDLFETAFFFPPQEHYYLGDDPENLALLEEDEENPEPQNPDPWAGLTYNFHPNPVINDLNIEIYMPKTGHIKMQLTNRPGLVVWTKDFGTRAEGIHETSVFMGGFPSGEYVLNMWFDDYMVGEIIIKK